MIVCGFNKNLQLNEQSTGKNSSNFPIVFPPLKSQLDISKLLSYSVCLRSSIWITSDGRAYAVGDNQNFQISGSLPKKAIEKSTEIIIKDDQGHQCKFISALCDGLFSLYLISPTNGSQKSQLAYVFKDKNNGIPLFLNLGDRNPVRLFGCFEKAAAIDSEGSIFIITDSIFQSPSKALQPFSLPNGEKAHFVTLCKESIIVISTSYKAYESPLKKNGPIDQLSLTEIPEFIGKKIVHVTSFSNHSLAVNSEGLVFGRGSNEYGQLCFSKDKKNVEKFTEIPALKKFKISAAYAGSNYSLFQTTEGKILASGKNWCGELFTKSGPNPHCIFSPVETIIKRGASFCITGSWVSAAFINASTPPMTPNLPVPLESTDHQQINKSDKNMNGIQEQSNQEPQKNESHENKDANDNQEPQKNESHENKNDNNLNGIQEQSNQEPQKKESHENKDANDNQEPQKKESHENKDANDNQEPQKKESHENKNDNNLNEIQKQSNQEPQKKESHENKNCINMSDNQEPQKKESHENKNDNNLNEIQKQSNQEPQKNESHENKDANDNQEPQKKESHENKDANDNQEPQKKESHENKNDNNLNEIQKQSNQEPQKNESYENKNDNNLNEIQKQSNQEPQKNESHENKDANDNQEPQKKESHENKNDNNLNEIQKQSNQEPQKNESYENKNDNNLNEIQKQSNQEPQKNESHENKDANDNQEPQKKESHENKNDNNLNEIQKQSNQEPQKNESYENKNDNNLNEIQKQSNQEPQKNESHENKDANDNQEPQKKESYENKNDNNLNEIQKQSNQEPQKKESHENKNCINMSDNQEPQKNESYENKNCINMSDNQEPQKNESYENKSGKNLNELQEQSNQEPQRKAPFENKNMNDNQEPQKNESYENMNEVQEQRSQEPQKDESLQMHLKTIISLEEQLEDQKNLAQKNKEEFEKKEKEYLLNIESLNKELEEAQVKSLKLKEFEDFKERETEYLQKIESLSKKLESIDQHDVILKEVEELEKKKANLQTEIASFEEKRKELMDEIQSARNELPRRGNEQSYTFLNTTQIDKIKKIKKLGRGATSEVFKISWDQIYALKVLDTSICKLDKSEDNNSDIMSGNEENEEEDEINNNELDYDKFKRFISEYYFLSSFDHPNIIKTFGFFPGDEKNDPSIILEYCPYNLKNCVKKLNNEERSRIIIQICDAMKFIHMHGIIHRDLKPENILLDSEKNVKLSDFGISKLIDLGTQITSMTQMTGTLNFMAPELIRAKDYDEKVDVYSFGVVAYIILMKGEYPNINVFDVYEGKKAEIPKEISKFSRNLIDKCWSLNPQDRPSFAQIYDSIKNNYFSLY